jgi:hypothetical protein
MRSVHLKDFCAPYTDVLSFLLRVSADSTTSHHQNANCKFPSWLTDHHTWHPLDHSKNYHFSPRNGTLSVSSMRDDGERMLEMRAVCNSIIENKDTHFMIAAHITIGW